MFIRIFDPKGFRVPYTEKKWRETPKVSGKHGSLEERRMPRAYYPYTTPTAAPETKPKGPPKNAKDSFPHASESTIEETDKEKRPHDPDIIGEMTDESAPAVSDCMSDQVICFKSDHDLKECMKIFNKNTHNYYPVLNDEMRVVGIVSDRQLMSHASKKIIEAKKKFKEIEIPEITEIMSSPVACVEPQSSLNEVARFMIDESISALPVVDDSEKVIGIVTRSDILRYLVNKSVLG